MNALRGRGRPELLDVVALLEGLPEHGLERGHVGTLVEHLADGVFEVEFSDDAGRAYALLPLRPHPFVVLRFQPA